jgi:hypothetical protein
MQSINYPLLACLVQAIFFLYPRMQSADLRSLSGGEERRVKAILCIHLSGLSVCEDFIPLAFATFHGRVALMRNIITSV